MPEKTVQDGGRERQSQNKVELPPAKTLTDLVYHGQKVEVYEGVGRNKDITLVGCKIEGLEHGDYLSMYLGDTHRVLSKAHVDEPTHAGAAMLTTFYLIQKGAANFSQFARIYAESIRVNVGFDGPDRKFTLDVYEKDGRAEAAVSLLSDLGVDRKDIKFNPDEFGSKPIR